MEDSGGLLFLTKNLDKQQQQQQQQQHLQLSSEDPAQLAEQQQDASHKSSDHTGPAKTLSSKRRILALIPLAFNSGRKDHPQLLEKTPKTNKAWLMMLLRNPHLIIVPVCVFVVIVGVCLFGVLYTANKEAALQKELAQRTAQEVADELLLLLLKLSDASLALATHVQRSPDWLRLEASFFLVAKEMFRQNQEFPYRLAELALLPFGKLSANWSPPPIRQASNDLFAGPEREEAVNTVQMRVLRFLGPVELPGSQDLSLIARYPVYIKDVDKDEDWNNPNGQTQPTDCPSGVCYNATSREKFWGFTNAIYSAASLVNGTDLRLARLADAGYRFRLVRPCREGPLEIVHSPRQIESEDVVVVPIAMPCREESWSLSLWKEGGWEPPYKDGLVAVVVVGTFVLSVLVLMLMASMKRSSLLLEDQMCTNSWLEQAKASLEEEKLQREALLTRQFDLIACFEHEKESNNTNNSLSDEMSAMGRIANIRQAINENNTGRGLSEELEVMELLGEGTFGKVHKGLWRGTVVAVKTMMLPSNMSGQEKREKMAIMEAAISSSLAHPNVVQTYTYSIKPILDSMHSNLLSGDHAVIVSPASLRPEDRHADPERASPERVMPALACKKGSVYSYEVRLILEYCDKGCLRTALDQEVFLSNSGLNYAAILDTAADIARAMLHLHCNNVVHADLKARNVMMSSSGSDSRGVHCKIADFGLAVRMEHTETHLSGLFQGTLTHMAPELLLEGRVSKAADVYAFGITCWELFTSGTPFHGTAKALLGHMIAREHRRPAFPNVTPKGFRALVERCWAHEPRDRPTFHQVVEELQRLRKAVPGPTPALVLPEPHRPVSEQINKLGSSVDSFERSPSACNTMHNILADGSFLTPKLPHVVINVSGGESRGESAGSAPQTGLPQQSASSGTQGSVEHHGQQGVGHWQADEGHQRRGGEEAAPGGGSAGEEKQRELEAARCAAAEAVIDLSGGQPLLPYKPCWGGMRQGDRDRGSLGSSTCDSGASIVNSVIIIGDDEASMFGVKAQEPGAGGSNAVLHSHRSHCYARSAIRMSLPVIGEQGEDSISSEEDR